jgi:hypothetical protein
MIGIKHELTRPALTMYKLSDLIIGIFTNKVISPNGWPLVDCCNFEFLVVSKYKKQVRDCMELPRMDAIQHTEDIRLRNRCIPISLGILCAALEERLLLEWDAVA